jgi:1,4-dihydroxy-2-naphthoyl-CoA hydrolase
MATAASAKLPGMSTMQFEHYDEAFAAEMIRAGDRVTGLPDYLGIRTVDVGPGRLVARLPVKTELLNPFGNLHGGVLAAFVDHLLGSVCYPVIRRGQWAARPSSRSTISRR